MPREMYLMEKLNMNEGFPGKNRMEIDPYFYMAYSLMDESGTKVSLGLWGDADGIGPEEIRQIKYIQDRGIVIRGDLHPFFKGQTFSGRPHNVLDIGGDMEVFQPLGYDSGSHRLLRTAGVNVVWLDNEAA